MVLFAATLCALTSAAPATERHGYVASNDGKGHWVLVLPEHAEVTGPAGALPARDDGIVPLMLELSCRDGEMPVRAILSFPTHPDDPPAERFLDNPLRNLWRGLVGDEPVFREEVRIGLGGSTFPASVVRQLTSYNTETDYQVLLPAGETVHEIAGTAGGSLIVAVKGSRVRAKTSYAIAAEFAQMVETMRRHCGT